MKGYIDEIFRLFNPLDIFLNLGAFLVANIGVLYYMTSNLIFALFLGIPGSLFFFHIFSYHTRKTNSYQKDLNDLMKYMTNVSFFLQTGENVYYALSTAKTSLDGNVRKDVQTTIEHLEEDAELVTDHFLKYDFPSIDQFHQNLRVKYELGGNSKELFESIQSNIMNELKKRDELYKRRKGFALNVYIMLGMVGVTGTILRLLTTDLWYLFMSYWYISYPVIVITYGAVLLNLYLLQKRVNDISVNI